MPGDPLVRNALEIVILVALGGMVWSAVGRLRAGRIPVYLCRACDRPTSRAYPDCRHCGAPRAGPAPPPHTTRPPRRDR